MRRKLKIVQAPQHYTEETYSAVKGLEIGKCVDVPFAGPYTCAKYQIVDREELGNGRVKIFYCLVR